MIRFILAIYLFGCWAHSPLFGQSILSAPSRAEGEGPYKQLIIRGATLINGTGAPPIGPVDVVIRNNKISQIKVVGAPGVTIDEIKIF